MKILLLCGLLASIFSLSIVEAQRRHRNVNGKIPSGTISVINAKPRNGTIIKKGKLISFMIDYIICLFVIHRSNYNWLEMEKIVKYQYLFHLLKNEKHNLY